MMTAIELRVGPRGLLSERAVLAALRLEDQRPAVRAIMGEVIGAPRDYRYEGGQFLFTAAGIRRLGAHFEVEAHVRQYEPKIRRWWMEGDR